MSSQRNWTRADLPRSLDRALEAAIARGAKLPVVLHLTEVAGYTDHALLLSARSDRQVRGIVDGIREALAGDSEAKLLGSDGTDLYLWALLDYGDFLIHVFYHPVRKHYDLESMWSDAPRVELGLPAELMDETELLGLAAPDPMPAYRGDLAFGGFEDEFEGDDEEGEDEEGDEGFEDEDFEDEDYEDEDFEAGDEDEESLFDEDEDDDAQAPVPAEPEREPARDDDLFEP